MKIERAPKIQTVSGAVSAIPQQKLNDVLVFLKKEDTKSAARYTLAVIGFLGLLGLIMAAPNALQAFAPFIRRKYGRLPTHAQRLLVQRSIYYLKRHGYISLGKSDMGLVARLTRKGKRLRASQQKQISRITHTNKWDGKWWLVAADIPTKTHGYAAHQLRRKLKSLGFYSLQRTLWLYPYCPVAELNILLNEYGIEKFTTVMEVSRLDSDDLEIVRKHFRV